jgi:hypothetical protein
MARQGVFGQEAGPLGFVYLDFGPRMKKVGYP